MTKPKTNNSLERKKRVNAKTRRMDDGERLYFSANRLTNAEYHGISSAVSSSALKELYYGKNPQYCYQKYILKTVPNKQTEAMLIGSATHKLILEPKTFHTEFVVWEGGRRAGGEWKAFKEYYSATKDIITQVQYEEIQILQEAVAKNTEAAQLLSGGIAEQSVFWRDSETSVLCRARCDYLKQSGNSKILIDLKTCISAEPEQFTKSLINLGYFLQSSMYTEGFKADAFAFVAVEKVTNTVQVYSLSDLFDQTGHFIFRQALEQWAEHLKTNNWPTYRTGVTTLECPEWFANKVLAYD